MAAEAGFNGFTVSFFFLYGLPYHRLAHGPQRMMLLDAFRKAPMGLHVALASRLGTTPTDRSSID